MCMKLYQCVCVSRKPKNLKYKKSNVIEKYYILSNKIKFKIGRIKFM